MITAGVGLYTMHQCVSLCVFTFHDLLYVGLSTNIGSIVGGVVGGLGALFILFLLAILSIAVVLRVLKKGSKCQSLTL